MIDGKLETRDKGPQNILMIADDPLPDSGGAGWISVQDEDGVFLRTEKELTTDPGPHGDADEDRETEGKDLGDYSRENGSEESRKVPKQEELTEMLEACQKKVRVEM